MTTEPNELMAVLHNRMPVIQREDDHDRWLGS
ncbi:MAG: SOS response-associated peptidase family protein [Geminicoccaceae bacterium]